jgi:hypothetical protein
MKDTSRRRFIRQTIAGTAGIIVLPSISGFRLGPNDTIRLGIIGLGQQAMYLMQGFARIPGVQMASSVKDLRRGSRSSTRRAGNRSM